MPTSRTQIPENMPTISVAMPVFLTNLEDLKRLQDVLSQIERQTYLPFEVVISSDTLDIELHNKMLETISSISLNIIIKKNQLLPNASSNTNNAVMACNGDLVHILHQDDLLIEDFAYEHIVDSYIENQFDWALMNRKGSPCNYVPRYHPGIVLGFNFIGGPSVLIFKTANFISFESDYLMFCDVINYAAYFKTFGDPFFFRKIHIEFCQREDSFSKTISVEQIEKEVKAVFLSGEIEFNQLVKMAFMDEYLTPHLRLVYESIFSIISVNFRRKFLLIMILGYVLTNLMLRRLVRYAKTRFLKVKVN